MVILLCTKLFRKLFFFRSINSLTSIWLMKGARVLRCNKTRRTYGKSFLPNSTLTISQSREIRGIVVGGASRASNEVTKYTHNLPFPSCIRFLIVHSFTFVIQGLCRHIYTYAITTCVTLIWTKNWTSRTSNNNNVHANAPAEVWKPLWWTVDYSYTFDRSHGTRATG